MHFDVTQCCFASFAAHMEHSRKEEEGVYIQGKGPPGINVLRLLLI